MALARNTRNVFALPLRYTGAFRFLGGEWTSGGLRMMYAGGVSGISSYPLGTLDQSSFILPQKPGGLGATTGNTGRVTGTATLVPAQPMQASDVLALTLTNAQLDQIISGIAEATGSLTAVSAALASAASAAASGTLSLTVDNALCGAIFSVTANGTLLFSPNAFLSALGNISASAGGPTPLSPEGLSAELLDNQDIELGFSLRESLRLVLASVAGKLSGSPGTTITIRNVGDSKNRIVATVDANGNRSAVTYDVGD